MLSSFVIFMLFQIKVDRQGDFDQDPLGETARSEGQTTLSSSLLQVCCHSYFDGYSEDTSVLNDKTFTMRMYIFEHTPNVPMEYV